LVAARLFTREEHAQSHCQIGNVRLSVDVIFDWLAGIEARDAA
jgi:hypothetical protein